MLQTLPETNKIDTGRKIEMQFKKIWTDGACIPNPGKGGWAWTDMNGNSEVGCENPSTNQRMELMAVIRAIQFHTVPLEIISDSQYVIMGSTQWRHSWKRNGWRSSQGQEVKNLDLWKLLDKTIEAHVDIKFTWIKGHSGDPGNDEADRLSVRASGATQEEIERAEAFYEKNKMRKKWTKRGVLH